MNAQQIAEKNAARSVLSGDDHMGTYGGADILAAKSDDDKFYGTPERVEIGGVPITLHPHQVCKLMEQRANDALQGMLYGDKFGAQDFEKIQKYMRDAQRKGRVKVKFN